MPDPLVIAPLTVRWLLLAVFLREYEVSCDEAGDLNVPPFLTEDDALYTDVPLGLLITIVGRFTPPCRSNVAAHHQFIPTFGA